MTYKVEIEFKHINQARNFVAKHKWPDSIGTLQSIVQQVEASFPREPRVGDEVRILTTADFVDNEYGKGHITDIVGGYYLIAGIFMPLIAIPVGGPAWKIEVVQ